MARPSGYSEKITTEICALIAEGSPLTKICKQKDMPGYATVMTWLGKYPEFQEKYARAREDQADTLADQILEISDDDSLDIGFDNEGKPFVKGENIQRSRLRVDSRKWLAGKMRPKKYGDKVSNEHSGPDGAAIPVGITVTFK